jgi:hypothetical protein
MKLPERIVINLLDQPQSCRDQRQWYSRNLGRLFGIIEAERRRMA